jgi:hypothetical protein
LCSVIVERDHWPPNQLIDNGISNLSEVSIHINEYAGAVPISPEIQADKY